MSRVRDGLLLVDKPSGPTSHDVVRRVRRAFPGVRVGHGGTLDPIASGLLPIVLGRATRLVRFLPLEPKVYQGTMRFGVVTTTDDVSGDVVSVSEAPPPAPLRATEAAAAFVGRIRQVPPAFSAKKVGGRRLHRLARAGTAVEPVAVEVEVRGLRLRPTDDPAVFAFEAAVSSGTYVRALARDLGSALGCGGTLVSLRRTRLGPFDVAGAASPEDEVEALARRVVPLDDVPLHLPVLRLDDQESARRFRSGGAVGEVDVEIEGAVQVRTGGALLGVGEAAGGIVRPRLVIPGG